MGTMARRQALTANYRRYSTLKNQIAQIQRHCTANQWSHRWNQLTTPFAHFDTSHAIMPMMQRKLGSARERRSAAARREEEVPNQHVSHRHT